LESDCPSDDELSQLARQAAGGDPQCAERLLLSLLPRVRNLVRYLVRGDRDVDDLSQEALVTVMVGLSSYRGDGAFHSWADRVVARSVFASLKRSRRDRADVEIEQAPERASVPPAQDAYALRREVVQELDELPRAQRSALVLHYVLGLSVPEVAREVDAPEETIKSRLRLGKQRLRQRLSGLPESHRRVG
jgi:RNA polymerase sigma-70 factor (ECF subfamily)